MELLWQAWPLCPEHGLGMHLTEDAEERLSWWCAVLKTVVARVTVGSNPTSTAGERSLTRYLGQGPFS